MEILYQDLRYGVRMLLKQPESRVQGRPPPDDANFFARREVQRTATDRLVISAGAGESQRIAGSRVRGRLDQRTDERGERERELRDRRPNNRARRDGAVGQSLVCRRYLFSNDGNPADQRVLFR